jgi:hypothetical protein
MYPTKHETKKKKEAASTASFLDISLNFDKINNGQLSVRLYEKKR